MSQMQVTVEFKNLAGLTESEIELQVAMAALIKKLSEERKISSKYVD
jgi:hypothetical protein